MKDSRSKSDTSFGSLLLTAFFLSNFFFRSFPIDAFYINALVGTVGISALLYTFATEKNSSYPVSIILYGLIASLVMMLSFFYNGNSGIEDFAWIWVYAGPASILLTKRIDYRWFKAAFYLVATFIAICVILGVSENGIFTTTNRNYISATAILLVCLFYLFQFRQTGRITLVPAAICVGVCLYGSGRSGIILGAALFVGILLFYLFYEKRLTFRKTMTVIVVLAIAFLIIWYFLGDTLQYLIYRFDREGLQSPRMTIWAEYWRAISHSLGDFLMGAPTTSSTGFTIARYKGNLHNAFFMLHARFGLIGIILITIGMIYAIARLIGQRDYLGVFLLSVLAVRASFDWLAFPGPYDPVFLFFIFSGSRGFCSVNRKEILVALETSPFTKHSTC